ncbi:hypothetical protein MKX67_13740 [Cytobacillus sp. FSL W7-1323]|uniref:DUF4944 domain-containing protein n=1 Tax=Cytobacillus kochii TaxID=859143 RepID=A0A248TML4_9BACI|nr:hypothetical protein [Cytobacillus kochii]ASV69375.1 hypothetical protein CKF48_19895 [Cytobacillus kochii]
MNRKLIIIFIFPLILVSWMIYSCKQPIVLKGKSSDGNWRAEYSPHHSPNPKGIWKGEATWLGGTNLPTLNFLVFKSGEEMVTLYDKPSDFPQGDVIEFVSIGDAPLYANYSLQIKWTYENKEFDEEINLERKKRFFILPF